MPKPKRSQPNRYTSSYRAAEVHQVMRWIKAGQCGCLIGLRSAGKSNFIHFLLNQDVRRRYLGRGFSNFAFVHIDLLRLAKRSELAVYDLVLERLVGLLEESGVKGKRRKDLISLHRETTRSRDPLTARQAIERCVDTLLQRPAQRLVLLFDEFDTAFGSIDPALFRSLRAIRDTYKERLVYIVVVANDLAYLRKDLAEVEHFYRLVSRNVCGVGPYSQADARQMVRYLISQRPLKLSNKDTACLVELSGGHAGLLKTTLSVLWESPQEPFETLVQTLNDEPMVQAECRKILDSLPESELAALRTLVNGSLPKPDALRYLRRKGLVRGGSFPTIFSPLFTAVIRQQLPPPAQGVHVDYQAREARVEGQLIHSLTDLEFEMLCYFYNHRGQICTKDDLIKNVYRQRYGAMQGGITDQMLQTLVSRLRKKIEPAPNRSGYIVTIRGEGYKLVGPGEK